MRIRPLILLILIVSLPIAGLTWLGLRVAHDDEAALQQRFEEVFAVQLRDIDGTISRHFTKLATELRATAHQVGNDVDETRRLIRSSPQVRQIIVLDEAGTVLHPDPATPLNLGEREFLNEAKELIQDRDLVHAAVSRSDLSQQNGSAQPLRQSKLSISDRAASGSGEGWHVWYWGRGVHLIF